MSFDLLYGRARGESSISAVVVGDDRQRATEVAAALAGDGIRTELTDLDEREVVPTGPFDVVTVAVAGTRPGPDCAALVRRARSWRPDASVVLVAAELAPATIRKCIEAGADGFVTDAAPDATLAATVRAVAGGQLALPRDLRRQIVKPVLTAREKQVVGMVVLGFTNQEIAARLFLAESTVKSHLSSIFSKLGVRSRSEAAALVLDPGENLAPGILAMSDAGLSRISDGERG